MRRVLLALQLVALAVGLTACSGDALALDPVASAATKTVESGSSRVEFTIAVNAAGQSVDMTGSGRFDYRKPRGEVTYRMQVPGLGDVSMDMRMVGGKLYLRLPEEIAGAGAPERQAVVRPRPRQVAPAGRARQPRLHAAAGSRADAAVPSRRQHRRQGERQRDPPGRRDDALRRPPGLPQGARCRARQARAPGRGAAARPPGHEADARPSSARRASRTRSSSTRTGSYGG